MSDKAPERITHDERGLDEIVIHDCMIHVERMGDGLYWAGIYRDGKRVTFVFHGPVTVQEDDLGLADWKQVQR